MFMPGDIYLNIEGVEGESKDSEHTKWMEILSFSWGVSQPGAGAPSSTGSHTSGKASFSPLSFSKMSDLSTPALVSACQSGKHFTKVTIDILRAAGDKREKYLAYELEDVAIGDYSLSGSDGGGVPIESFSLWYGKYKLTYKATGTDTGAQKGQKAAEWDLRANKGDAAAK
jgi:type VI secretion system secreted protein Hcp